MVSDYNGTAAAKPDKHITRAVAIACTDDFCGLYLVDLHLVFSHSELHLDRNQLQQLPPGVFSDLTSLRSHVWLYEMRMCVCLVIHAQIKYISRFTHPQTYVSTSCSDVHLIPCECVCYFAYACWLFFPPSVLPQHSVSQRQPAAAAACSGVLGPDILVVSRCICMQWECVYSWRYRDKVHTQ